MIKLPHNFKNELDSLKINNINVELTQITKLNTTIEENCRSSLSDFEMMGLQQTISNINKCIDYIKNIIHNKKGK